MKPLSLRPILWAALTLALPLGFASRGLAQPNDDQLETTIFMAPLIDKLPEKARTDAEWRAQFAQADELRAQAKADSIARAEAAETAMNAAANIAWNAFQTSHFDEAATWFARRAALKKEGYDNRWAAIKAESAHNHRVIAEKIAKATTAKDKTFWRDFIPTLNTIYYNKLYILTLANHDPQRQLELTREALAVRRAELAQLQKDHATANVIGAKRASVAEAMETIAQAQTALAMYDDAEKNLTEALRIRTSLPVDLPERNLSEGYRNFGVLYAALGDLPRARQSYKQSLAALRDPQVLAAQIKVREVAQTPENKAVIHTVQILGQGVAMNNLGGIIKEMGDYKSALDWYQKADAAFATIPTTTKDTFPRHMQLQMRAITRGNIAALHAETGQIAPAQAEFGEVVAQLTALGEEEGAASALQNLSGIYQVQGELEKAKNYTLQARQIFIGTQNLRSVVNTGLSLSSLARRQDQWDEAEKYAQEALALARTVGDLGWLNQALQEMAKIRLQQKRPQDALVFLQESETINQRVGAPLDISDTLDLQGQALEAQKQPQAALEKYQASIKIFESARATAASEEDFSSVGKRYEVYERAVKLLLQLQQPEAAFDILNRAKSKKIQDSLRLSSLKSGDQAVQKLLDLAGTLQSKLRTAQTQLQSEQQKPAAERNPVAIDNLQHLVAQTRGEFSQLVLKIKQANPNYDKVINVDPMVLKKAQSDLPDDVLLIEYAPLGDQLYIFLVTKTDLKIYAPPVKLDDLWNRIREVRAQIATPPARDVRGATLRSDTQALALGDLNKLNENLSVLYEMLIAPIEKDIAAKKTLAFLPTQLLYYLPMQALAKKQGDGYRYLIEEKPIVYLAATDIPVVIGERDAAAMGKGLIAFGNPTGANLPFALQEVNDIAKVFPGTQVLAGNAATKISALEEETTQKRILHFATHGILDQNDTFKSYILLAKTAQPQDSELTFGEVTGLDLQKVDLVTLSACETALGKNADGREITSLAKSFSDAGAKAVIASLWSVADQSTSTLMTDFYRELAVGKSKGEALQSAEIAVLKNPQYAHPFYWAPFILMGDWR